MRLAASRNVAVKCEGCRRDQRTLCYHAAHHTQASQLPTRIVRYIRPRAIQIRPAEETPRPIPFPRLMVLAELIVVDRFIRLVQRVRAIRASIVRQARCYRDAGASKQQRLSILSHSPRGSSELRRDARLLRRTGGQAGRKELDERGNGAARRCRAERDYLRQGQGIGVRDAQNRHCSSSSPFASMVCVFWSDKKHRGGPSSAHTQASGGYVIEAELARTVAGMQCMHACLRSDLTLRSG